MSSVFGDPAKLFTTPARSGERASEENRRREVTGPPCSKSIKDMAPSRLAMRLGELSHAQLLQIAVAGCEASSEINNLADAFFATHKPLPQWAVEGVLLSNDLVPHILASLQLEDGAAAAVCSSWADAWKATSEARRHLRRVAFDIPQDLLGMADYFELVAISSDTDAEPQLLVRSGGTVRILARNMCTKRSLFDAAFDRDDSVIAADGQSIYVIVRSGQPLQPGSVTVRRLAHDGSELASYEDHKFPFRGVLARGGYFFCVGQGLDDHDDEILVLDAQSLQPRYRFGLSLFNGAADIVLIDGSLVVCDTENDRLQVFSLTGEHLCSITGEWKRPVGLCFVKDRLYLIEESQDEEEGDETELCDPLRGRRIFVLSLQGDTLEVFQNPVEGHSFDGTIVYFDGMLLAPFQRTKRRGEEFVAPVVGVMALRGV